MKPAKIQNGSNKNLKQISENSSASKMKLYFKPAEKSFVVPVPSKKGHADGGPKEFYVQMLKNKIQKINGTDSEDSNQMNGACASIEKQSDIVQTPGDDGACALPEKQNENIKNPGGCPGCNCCECDQKRNESSEWQEKYKELKKLYLKLAVDYSELHLKNKDLLKTVTGQKCSNNEGPSTDEAAGGSNTEAAVDGGVLTSGEIKFVECMPLDKNKDSTFVLQCLQFMYKDNPRIMATKSLNGTKGKIEITADGREVHHPAKQPLTPPKANKIRELFINRISKCEINSAEYGERIKPPYLNKLFASGIKNMSRKQ